MRKSPRAFGFLQDLLACFGQSFFQKSPVCGAFVVTGIALNSPKMLSGALLGLLFERLGLVMLTAPFILTLWFAPTLLGWTENRSNQRNRV